MSYRHAIVWLDHRRATVVRFSRVSSATHTVHGTASTTRVHTKSGIPGSGHLADDLEMFDEIVRRLAGVEEVLVTGPGVAKLAFQRHVESRHPDLAARIVDVVTVDHPNSRNLLAFGRTFFERVDALGEDPSRR